MKTRPIAVALLLAFTPATFAVVPRAVAQADDPTTKAARARFQEGVDFYDKGQYENARASFLQAYALRKHPAVLLNLAQSCLRSGHALEAAKFFQQYLRESTSISASQRNDAERGLNEARTKLGRITVDAPQGTEIYVDDERVGQTPLRDSVDVEPGSHIVKARGRIDETQAVTATAGHEVTARFGNPSAPAAVVPVAPPPPPSTPPPAPAQTPPPSTEPEAPPPATTTEPVTSTTAEPEPEAKGHLKGVPVLILGGVVAVAGFVTAGVLGVAKSNAQTNADSLTQQIRTAADDPKNQWDRNAGGPCSTKQSANVQRIFGKACAALNDNNDKINTDATIANVALGVGLVATAFTIVWAAVAVRREKHTTAWHPPVVVTPIIGQGTGGLTIGAAF
jgi:hypothetical protein